MRVFKRFLILGTRMLSVPFNQFRRTAQKTVQKVARRSGKYNVQMGSSNFLSDVKPEIAISENWSSMFSAEQIDV